MKSIPHHHQELQHGVQVIDDRWGVNLTGYSETERLVTGLHRKPGGRVYGDTSEDATWHQTHSLLVDPPPPTRTQNIPCELPQSGQVSGMPGLGVIDQGNDL